MPKDPTPQPVERQDAFLSEIRAVKDDPAIDWAPVTGEIVEIGEPPDRYDLIPHGPLEQVAILFGKRETETTAGKALENHALASMRHAQIVTGDVRRHHLIEAARACLILADQ